MWTDNLMNGVVGGFILAGVAVLFAIFLRYLDTWIWGKK